MTQYISSRGTVTERREPAEKESRCAGAQHIYQIVKSQSGQIVRIERIQL